MYYQISDSDIHRYPLIWEADYDKPYTCLYTEGKLFVPNTSFATESQPSSDATKRVSLK